MASRHDGDETAIPLLGRKTAVADGWLNKVIDVEEAKVQILFALPMILTNVAYFFIPLVSVMFAGHLGHLQLAGANLGSSWGTVTGFTFMVGLSGALETLCGQAFGRKMYRMLGIYLQASCLISIIFCMIVSVIWWYSDAILVLLNQDPEIAKEACLYLKYLIPGLFAYGLLQNMLRFLQTQSIVMPLVVCSSVPVVLHIGIAHVMVNLTSSLGFTGAPLAASISLWISVFLLAFYLLTSEKFKKTWEGFNLESLSYVVITLKLALPSAAMVCLEYWAFEILVLLAGMMPNSETSTSLIAMCVNTETISYMIAYGLSAVASTRVSNELGSGNPNCAKGATVVTLKLTAVPALIVVLALLIGHDLWASSFSSSPVIINAFASMTPFVMVSVICDFVQGILSGVARGCGWQHLVVFINLGTFYLIGMPIACLLGFVLKLHARGLWIGLICGLTIQMSGLLLLTRFTKWTRMEMSQGSSTKEVFEDNV